MNDPRTGLWHNPALDTQAAGKFAVQLLPETSVPYEPMASHLTIEQRQLAALERLVVETIRANELLEALVALGKPQEVVGHVGAFVPASAKKPGKRN